MHCPFCVTSLRRADSVTRKYSSNSDDFDDQYGTGHYCADGIYEPDKHTGFPGGRDDYDLLDNSDWCSSCGKNITDGRLSALSWAPKRESQWLSVKEKKRMKSGDWYPPLGKERKKKRGPTKKAANKSWSAGKHKSLVAAKRKEERASAAAFSKPVSIRRRIITGRKKR